MKVLQLRIPHGLSGFGDIIEMFQRAGCKVDDLCGVDSEGRVIDVWMPPDILDEKSLDEHPGYFLGEGES